MTIIDALKSGKYFKRKGEKNDIWYRVENYDELEKLGYLYTHTIYEIDPAYGMEEKAEPFQYEDIVAEDWEVQEERPDTIHGE